MPASARILEIGDFHYVKDQYPERTTLLWTGGRPPRLGRSNYFDCTPGRFVRTIAEVQEAEHEVVGVLVLVAVLEGEDLEHGVRQHIRDSDAHLRRAAPVETLSFEKALDEVVAHEIGATNVERSDDRPGGSGLRSEDEPGRHRFRLAQELDDDLGALDFSCPAKQRSSPVQVKGNWHCSCYH